MTIDEANELRKAGYIHGYHNAIDDFVNLAKEHEFKYKKEDITKCCIDFIVFFAKQLKEGNKQ